MANRHRFRLFFASLFATLLIFFGFVSPSHAESVESAANKAIKEEVSDIQHAEVVNRANDLMTGPLSLEDGNVIVGTMDGNIVCLDSETGAQIWSFKTGPDLIKSSLTQLIPSLNGNLYLYHDGQLEKHPLNVYEMVTKAPFGLNDNLLYMGSKDTQLYAIDPKTGEIHRCASSLSDSCGDLDITNKILVLRADYSVKAVDQMTGETRWNISLGEFSTSSSYGISLDDPNGFENRKLPPRPTHGLLSGMDGSLRLVDLPSGRPVWTVMLPSPAIHKQNIASVHSSGMVLGDLTFVPQLMLTLDPRSLPTGESRVFIGDHSGSLVAIEQLAQYYPPFTSTEDGVYGDDSPLLHLPGDGKEQNFEFPTSNQKLPVPALPSDSDKNSQPVNHDSDATYIHNPKNNGDYVIVDHDGDGKDDNEGNRWSQISRRTCKGPNDLSMECILGIHYIQSDPNCVGDDCVCDSTPRLTAGTITPRLPDRPSNPLLPMHPNFDWEKGDYDFILYSIVLVDWYIQAFKAYPWYIQAIVSVSILGGSVYLFYLRLYTWIRRKQLQRLEEEKKKEMLKKKELAKRNPPKVKEEIISKVLKPSIPDSNGIIIVGKLEVHTTKILGHGSSGTLVFEGMMDNRKVAVKRMLKTFFSIAEHETHVLTQSDEHPNVIRYYTTEEDADFIYLALSYAERSLANFVEDEETFSSLTEHSKRDILHQLAQGMKNLHGINVLHRDIKPQNVLVTGNGVIKISDMGLAKKLESDALSLSTAAHGTIGWQAPELVLGRIDASSEWSESSSKSSSGEKAGRVKISKKVDIFSLGCLFYYSLTRKHPYGDRLIRESNVVNNMFNLSNEIGAEACDLISKMICADPKLRPCIEQILDHPYFWDASKRLRLLKDASDFLEFEKPTSDVILRFERAADDAHVIPGRDWIVTLPNDILQDLHKFRKYNCSKLRDLLRVIRNRAHHYRDLPPEAQQVFGALPDGFLDYFCSARFPKLLTFTWDYARINYSQDKVFREYFLNEKPPSCDALESPSSAELSAHKDIEPFETSTTPVKAKSSTPAWTGSLPNGVVSPSGNTSHLDLPPGLEVGSDPKRHTISPTRQSPNRPSSSNNNNVAKGNHGKDGKDGKDGNNNNNNKWKSHQPNNTTKPGGQSNGGHSNADSSNNWRSRH